MKLLMFQAAGFGYSPDSLQALEAIDQPEVVVFIHAEPADVDRTDLLRKAAKNIKWLANKRGIDRICLHSFAHLAEDKAPAGFAEGFIETLGRRLQETGYGVRHTPFGHSCAWTLSVYQDPIAKVFKSL